MLTVKTAAEDPETQEDRVILLLERAREAKNPTTRGLHLSKALAQLTSLPTEKPPAPEGLTSHAPATTTSAFCHAIRLCLDLSLSAATVYYVC